MNDYFVLRVKNLDTTAEEWLSEKAFSFGALGISEQLPFSQPEGEEDVSTQIPDRRSLEIYFQIPPSAAFVEEVKSNFPQVEMNVQGEANRDWLAEWKKGYKPFSLTEKHWVVPSWCTPPAEAQHKIWIDPGMAFGTGTHETTQLCATLFEKISSDYKFYSCLDVGTGTGILAILARQLGVEKVRATEIEVDSRRVAHENFAANKIDDILLTSDQIDDLSEKFDVVIANIIDGVLVRIQDDLKARLKPGGWLILSGIIAEREREFLWHFDLPPGRSWLKRVRKGDWLAYATRL